MIKEKLKNIWFRLFCLSRWWVVCDGTDNSITLSGPVWQDIKCRYIDENTETLKVVVFKLGEKNYGFMVAENFDVNTQLSEIQYNSKHNTIGFESLCPTVNRILYDYGLPSGKYKLSVRAEAVRATRKVFYRIERPSLHKQI